VMDTENVLVELQLQIQWEEH